MPKDLGDAKILAMRKTPTYRLIEDRLGKDLRRHVSTAWHRGDSWATIARDLHASTGLPVSPETVRLWFPHLKPHMRRVAS